MHAWDEGVAFYTGSLAADTPNAAGGKLIWALAEKRCKNYKTCGPNGDSTSLSGTTAKVNNDLLFEFNKGRDALQAGKCAEVRPIVRKVVSLMTIPLVQGTIRYARYMSTGQMGSDKQSEAAVFAASVLPMVHACSPADAKIIDDHTKLVDGRATGGAAQFTDVKAAFERNYACLGITCADVGGLWQRRPQRLLPGRRPVRRVAAAAAAADAVDAAGVSVGDRGGPPDGRPRRHHRRGGRRCLRRRLRPDHGVQGALGLADLHAARREAVGLSRPPAEAPPAARCAPRVRLEEKIAAQAIPAARRPRPLPPEQRSTYMPRVLNERERERTEIDAPSWIKDVKKMARVRTLYFSYSALHLHS